MKKVMAMILAATMVFGLAACGKTSDSAKQKQSSAKIHADKDETVPENKKEDSMSESKSTGTNILVVYYSATGNTKSVAEKIAAQTNGELFELKPVDEYTEEDLDYNDSESRVSKEHDNDFAGKTVIPFCTSASSGIGESGDLLEEMAGTGNWQEGRRFSANATDSEIQDWIKSLDLNQN